MRPRAQPRQLNPSPPTPPPPPPILPHKHTHTRAHTHTHARTRVARVHGLEGGVVADWPVSKLADTTTTTTTNTATYTHTRARTHTHARACARARRGHGCRLAGNVWCAAVGGLEQGVLLPDVAARAQACNTQAVTAVRILRLLLPLFFLTPWSWPCPHPRARSRWGPQYVVGPVVPTRRR